ncbi:MAG: KpsF/GutQ family sugar-phosphate isomerase [Gammaproteobacteria bacterium]|nr:KpsF/GutQ family sugar-phosphate isomerase [Gammaproteobacteria bacterium]
MSPTQTQVTPFAKSALRTIGLEQAAIAELVTRIDASFEQACQLLIDCSARVVLLGMGKSGHIANKIAATLASTGTPAFFVHPGEASHGDMGMITANDVVLALSYSGTTSEIVTLLPILKRLGTPIIAMTGVANSTLAVTADVHLNINVSTEACPLNLAPTSSTTASLVMGDALAIALLEAKGFNAKDFAFSHPGGALGRKLLLKVSDIMHSGSALPQVTQDASFADALMEMTQKSMGMTAVVNPQGKLTGIYTDGDLRRSLDHSQDLRQCQVDELMTRDPVRARADMLAAQALKLMEQHKINALIVCNHNDQPVGAINMHDLLKAGVI